MENLKKKLDAHNSDKDGLNNHNESSYENKQMNAELKSIFNISKTLILILLFSSN